MKVIAFDLDGVLCAGSGKQRVLLPGAKRLLSALAKDGFTVGIFTSMTRGNALSVAPAGLAFLLTREHTDPDPDLGGFRTIKRIEVVYEHCPGACDENTVLVDNSAEKLRFNPVCTQLIYSGELYSDLYKSLKARFQVK